MNIQKWERRNSEKKQKAYEGIFEQFIFSLQNSRKKTL